MIDLTEFDGWSDVLDARERGDLRGIAKRFRDPTVTVRQHERDFVADCLDGLIRRPSGRRQLKEEMIEIEMRGRAKAICKWLEEIDGWEKSTARIARCAELLGVSINTIRSDLDSPDTFRQMIGGGCLIQEANDLLRGDGDFSFTMDDLRQAVFEPTN